MNDALVYDDSQVIERSPRPLFHDVPQLADQYVKMVSSRMDAASTTTAAAADASHVLEKK